MATFDQVLKDINAGVQGLSAALPTISQNGINSVQGIQAVVAAAGATAATVTQDTTRQNEIIAAAQTALTIIPLIFSLFHHSAAAKTPATS